MESGAQAMRSICGIVRNVVFSCFFISTWEGERFTFTFTKSRFAQYLYYLDGSYFVSVPVSDIHSQWTPGFCRPSDILMVRHLGLWCDARGNGARSPKPIFCTHFLHERGCSLLWECFYRSSLRKSTRKLIMESISFMFARNIPPFRIAADQSSDS